MYEARPSDSEVFASGVILTPNSLRVLDRLGVLARIKDRCYLSTHRTFKNDKDETIRKVLITNESLYGYRNHRIWRKLLLDEMRQMLTERGIKINYEARLDGIVNDSLFGVTFAVNDHPHQADMLIASDGIYSTVRKYLDPTIAPSYTGVVGVLAHIKRDDVSWPYADYERNATIQGKPGALFWIAEDPSDNPEIMIGSRVQYPEQSREDLDRLQADKDKLLEFYQKGYEDHGLTARSIIDAVARRKEDLFIWPFMRMPRLERWYSDTGRVVLMGDAAHAIPPSSGQGVNQAIEDGYALAMLLSEGRKAVDGETADAANGRVLEALAFWQKLRQERIDAVFDWATNSANVQRMPEAERKKLVAEGRIKEGSEGERDDMSWLYSRNLEDDVRKWIASKA